MFCRQALRGLRYIAFPVIVGLGASVEASTIVHGDPGQVLWQISAPGSPLPGGTIAVGFSLKLDWVRFGDDEIGEEQPDPDPPPPPPPPPPPKPPSAHELFQKALKTWLKRNEERFAIENDVNIPAEEKERRLAEKDREIDEAAQERDTAEERLQNDAHFALDQATKKLQEKTAERHAVEQDDDLPPDEKDKKLAEIDKEIEEANEEAEKAADRIAAEELEEELQEIQDVIDDAEEAEKRRLRAEQRKLEEEKEDRVKGEVDIDFVPLVLPPPTIPLQDLERIGNDFEGFFVDRGAFEIDKILLVTADLGERTLYTNLFIYQLDFFGIDANGAATALSSTRGHYILGPAPFPLPPTAAGLGAGVLLLVLLRRRRTRSASGLRS